MNCLVWISTRFAIPRKASLTWKTVGILAFLMGNSPALRAETTDDHRCATTVASTQTGSGPEQAIAAAWMELLTQGRTLPPEELESIRGRLDASSGDPASALFVLENAFLDTATRQALEELDDMTRTLIQEGSLSAASLIPALRSEVGKLERRHGAELSVAAQSDRIRSRSVIPVQVLTDAKNYTRTAAFDPSGDRFVTADDDGTAILRDRDGGLLLRWGSRRQPIHTTSFSPDGSRILSTGSDNVARVWDLQGHLLTTLEGHEGVVEAARFSPDGRLLVTASRDHTARIWDLQGNLVQTLRGHVEAVTFADFSPDGTRVATASYDGTLRIWSVKDGSSTLFSKSPEWLVRVKTLVNGPQYHPPVFAFSPDGTRISVGFDERTVRTFDLLGRPLGTLEGHGERLASIVYSRDGTRILTSSLDSTARLWNAATGAEVARFQSNHTPLRFAVFTPDQSQVVVVSYDNDIRFWDFQGSEPRMVRELPDHMQLITSIAFSPDGLDLVSTSWDRSVRLWHLDAWDEQAGSSLGGQAP